MSAFSLFSLLRELHAVICYYLSLSDSPRERKQNRRENQNFLKLLRFVANTERNAFTMHANAINAAMHAIYCELLTTSITLAFIMNQVSHIGDFESIKIADI
jgi:hypothetical protein